MKQTYLASIAAFAACLVTCTGCSIPRTREPSDPPVFSQNAQTTAETPLLTGISASPEELLAAMTLEEKIAQMMMPDFRCWDTDSGAQEPVYVLHEEQAAAITRYHFGGVILFSENMETAEQTVRLIDSLQNANADGGRTGLMIAVDQEGGSISRLTMGCQMPGNMALGAAGSEDLAQRSYALMANELRALGFNTDFAPSLDINSNPSNPVIGIRSFGDDPEAAAALGCAGIKGLQSEEIIPAVKHFPGHGDTAIDSHTGLPLIDKSLEEIEHAELLPFRQAIENGAEIVMTAHIQYPQIESDTYVSLATGETVTLPATLSDDVLTGILRNKLRFDGVIITDSMVMDAIKEHFDSLDAAKLAINGGVDMLLMSVNTANPAQLDAVDSYISGIAAMVNNGEIPQSRIDESVLRILRLKEKYGILSPIAPDADDTASRAAAALDYVGSKGNHEIEWDIASRTTTLLSNENDALPIGSDETVAMFYPYASQRQSLEYAVERLQEDGLLPSDAAITYYSYEEPDAQSIASQITNVDTVIAVSSLYSAEEMNPNSPDGAGSAYLDALLAQTHQNDADFVLISSQLPYDTARYPDADAILVCYAAKGMLEKPGDFSGTTTAYGPNLIAAIYAAFGGNIPTGRLPVNVPALDASYHYTEEILYERGSNAFAQ